ncbi:Geraniol 8-hydroxylase [Acorus gramineus]|uniref:Geraniol 8-hydroxylase n=1 Tax=Acorus gramineus TaxID=55184 RepID=A0AAV9BGV7_ACOGR|nr:Geraniol 8-hydroxylase [Acorus gramineus]
MKEILRLHPPVPFLIQRKAEADGKNFELIPFGSGCRTCPGLPLVDRLRHLMLASLLCSFRWSLPDKMSPRDMDMSCMFGITLAKAVLLHVVPIRH